MTNEPQKPAATPTELQVHDDLTTIQLAYQTLSEEERAEIKATAERIAAETNQDVHRVTMELYQKDILAREQAAMYAREDAKTAPPTE
ncbi:hypothetical protein COU74_02780 [Candidatus Peregrinibacteria bacterium CG10_big_fil_rev_8_21_14_0_10_36_19]|nr:MAG: hypothetical protein COU74_02780 [Candidatus Peregrinibacteria bacterium CG10_big_fil_rev_8_21_14_0_10_36_19]